ncbi:MAG: DUF6046 domain-containing protein [Prevotellaceae bacterium]|jgi:hypothetical protein|nr:DUF6046 domain-containing protein [Prevotellaceae bacterium]
MRYITDILQRYQGGWAYLTGLGASQLEGAFNRGLFAAGLAANEAAIKKAQKSRNDKDYKISLYPEEIKFADIEFVYNEQSLKFGFNYLADDSQFDESWGGYFAPPPIVSFRREKNIGVTIIDNADEAEIVENFSTNSWDIDIKGILIDFENHRYPKEAMQKFARFFEINDIIEVKNSKLFNDLGIYSVWFKEQSIEPVEAFPDTMRFILQAKSIKPAEFSIINGI